MESPEKQDYEAKNKVYYAAMLSAWLNTKLEYDKQMLGVSVTAVGLLVTLIRTTGASSILQKSLFGGALLSFLVTIIVVFRILAVNAKYIEKIKKIKEEEEKEEEKKEEEEKPETLELILSNLDRFAKLSFVFGIVLVAVIGFTSMEINLGRKEINMSREKLNNIQNQLGAEKDSLNGLFGMRPKSQKTPQIPNSSPVQSSPMDKTTVRSLAELLPELSQLSQEEKIQVIQILLKEVAQ